MIRVERHDGATDLDTTANRILSVLEKDFPDNRLVDSSTEIVGAVVGNELRRQARNATLFSLLAMLIYIGFRFEPILESPPRSPYFTTCW